MDPFELMCRRPTPVKSSSTNNDFDFDEGLIDRVLGKPNKIDIPERYIPEREQLPPEEEEKRSQKAEAICRLLSKSNSAAGPLPLVLPHPNRHSYHQNQNPQHHQHQHPSHHQHQHPSHHQHQHPSHHQHKHQHPSHQRYQHPQQHHQYQHQHQNHHNNISYGSSKSLQSGVSASVSLGVNSHLQGLPVSPGRRPLSSSLKKASSSSRLNNRTPTRNASTCDWSLAGVSAPTSPHPSSNLSRNSYYSSNSASSLYTPSPCPVVNTKPSHSYHSSYSSTSSGRSSSDREDLLHLQHNIAREVTEKSRLVAVRALASSPCATPLRFNTGNRYRDPSPPSPIDLPTIQQREGFFT